MREGEGGVLLGDTGVTFFQQALLRKERASGGPLFPAVFSSIASGG